MAILITYLKVAFFNGLVLLLRIFFCFDLIHILIAEFPKYIYEDFLSLDPIEISSECVFTQPVRHG